MFARGPGMRRLPTALLTIALICASAGLAAAQSPTASPDAAGQRIELPGFGASVSVPEHWTTDVSGNRGVTLYPESRLFEDLALEVVGVREYQHCRLGASSPPTCDASVDLAAELATPGWDAVSLPAGEAAHQASTGPGVACSRYLLTDGLDVYQLRCCGADRPADDWRSIADTFTFPEQSRWDSPDAAGRDLRREVDAVWQKEGIRPVGWKHGEGDRRTAKQHINKPRTESGKGDAAAIRAMVEVLGVPAKQVSIGERHYESDEGEVLLAVDSVRVRGVPTKAVRIPSAPTEVVLDGLLVWLAHDWDRRYEDPAHFEALDIGGRDVVAVTFGADDPTEYVLASGDTAIRVRGSDEEAAVTMLQALSCRHVDV